MKLVDFYCYKKAKEAGQNAFALSYHFPSIFEESDEVPRYKQKLDLQGYPTGKLIYQTYIIPTEKDYVDFLKRDVLEEGESIAPYLTEKSLKDKYIQCEEFIDYLTEINEKEAYLDFINYWSQYSPDDEYDPDVWY